MKRVAISLLDLFRATYCHRHQSARRYERLVKVNDIHQIAQFNSDIAIFSRERHVTSDFNNKDKKNTLAKFESQRTLKTTIKIFRRKRSSRRENHSHLVYCQFLLSHQAFAQLTLFSLSASKAIWIYDQAIDQTVQCNNDEKTSESRTWHSRDCVRLNSNEHEWHWDKSRCHHENQEVINEHDEIQITRIDSTSVIRYRIQLNSTAMTRKQVNRERDIRKIASDSIQTSMNDIEINHDVIMKIKSLSTSMMKFK